MTVCCGGDRELHLTPGQFAEDRQNVIVELPE